MSNIQHTGIIVSAKEADAWHAKIRKIMEFHGLNFGPAVDYYIKQQEAGKRRESGL